MSKILKAREAVQRPGNGAGVRLTTSIQIRIKKRGGRKVIVPPSGNAVIKTAAENLHEIKWRSRQYPQGKRRKERG